MVFHCQLAVGSLNLLVSGLFRHLQNVIEILPASRKIYLKRIPSQRGTKRARSASEQYKMHMHKCKIKTLQSAPRCGSHCQQYEAKQPESVRSHNKDLWHLSSEQSNHAKVLAARARAYRKRARDDATRKHQPERILERRQTVDTLRLHKCRMVPCVPAMNVTAKLGAAPPAALRRSASHAGAAPRANLRRRGAGFVVRAAIADPPPASAGVDPAFKSFARPDSFGRFGKYGGKYVPETLIAALEELEETYMKISKDEGFQARPIT